MMITYTDLIVADHSRSAQGRVHFINATPSYTPMPSAIPMHPEQDALDLGFWSFSFQSTLSMRGEPAVSVVPYTRRLQGKPFDGGNERAVEGQTPSEVSGPLIEPILTGQGVRKSIQRILKLRRRRFGANSSVRRQGLQGCRHGHIEIDRRRPSRLRKAGWIMSLASEREQ